MAVSSLKEKTLLKLEFDAGIANDKQQYSRVTYSKVRTDATDEAMYAVGAAIANLSEKQLLNVKRSDDTKITEI